MSDSKLVCSKETCHDNIDCGKFATCVNNEIGGGYKCVCNMGFEENTVMNGPTTCSMSECGTEDDFCGENTVCHDSTRNPICDVNMDSIENPPSDRRTASRGTAGDSVLHNSAHAWTLDSDPKDDDWLEIDLGRVVEILGVVIQGFGQNRRIGRFEVSLYQTEAHNQEVKITDLKYENIDDDYEFIPFPYVLSIISSHSNLLYCN